jgi:thioesterase domain-containing protein/aryl carrier-like protein
MLQATPSTWRMLLDAGWNGNRRLRLLSGGEALPEDLADKLLSRCKQLWNLYGPTETTIWSTLCRIRRGDEITIGRPIANTRVYVLDGNLQPTLPGLSGELWIGGHGVARGYRNRPDLTADSFLPNPFSDGDRIYRTGDVARFMLDGRLVHIGRSDFQVKIRGFRVELGEIEVALARVAKLENVVVAAKEDSIGNKNLVAYLLAGDSPPGATELRNALREELPEYMIPSHFVFLDAFPLTANKKIDIPALPAPDESSEAMTVGSAVPHGRLEVQLLALWRQVLADDSLGVEDNFFERGGHSLRAVQLATQIEQISGHEIPLAMLFEAPTVNAMARLLGRSGWKPTWRSLVAIQPNGTAPPVFCIPGVGGNVLMFAGLANRLGNQQPFYGLQARGLDTSEVPFTSIPRMAEHYVAEMRSVRPHGPYVVIGACTGGVVAFEIAARLRDAGEQVVLALLESWHPSSARRPRLAGRLTVQIRFLLQKLRSFRSKLARARLTEWPFMVAVAARRGFALLLPRRNPTPDSSELHRNRVETATWLAVSRYDPKPLQGSLLHIMASGRRLEPGTQDTRPMWKDLASQGARENFVAAADSGQLLVPLHVGETAALLRTYMDEQSRDTPA